MYPINFERIEDQFMYLEQCQQVLEKVGRTHVGLVEQFATARALHIGVECMIDVGSLLIDGFMMRDPGGYEDIVDILTDERVLSSDQGSRIKELVRFREQLVRSYEKVNPVDLVKFQKKSDLFSLFMQAVEAFLVKEKAEGNLERSLRT